MNTEYKSKTYYGDFGGMFMPELLATAMQALADEFERVKTDHTFKNTLTTLLQQYAGRETPLTEVKNFRQACEGPQVFLKREDLLHTGAHKINNALGQCLLAKQMKKTRVIAETGAGQHGVATATACAHFGLQCDIYMGEIDRQRQLPNVEKMKLLGANVISVDSGSKTLKDAVNAAMRDYAASFSNTHYCLGSALGPYPYPQMVAYFQAVIGDEVKRQCKNTIGKNPDTIIACIGGGSNAIGIFSAFLNDESVKLVGVEGGGHGTKLGQHAARFSGGRPGVLHGSYSYLLQDDHGQIAPTHSISAGLDYPMIGPQHADLYTRNRVHYTSATDIEALHAFELLSRTEGIIPALESSHALAYYINNAKHFAKEDCVVINLSGRGDKDLPALLAKGLL
ncbi:MAG: tryptophan synthase subunit beta [Pseudomonadota bacterium]